MTPLARRQRYLWLPAVLVAGVVSLLTGPLIDGTWLLMLTIGAAAIADTHTTTRRNQP
jgi:hypothetical protein